MRMPRAEAFMKRTSVIYYSMVKRFAERRNKRGRIIRIGRQLPFTLAMFRDWVSDQLGGTPEGATRCRYCGRFLTAMDMQCDHVHPVEQDGSLALENLAPCCAMCNRLKGSLTEATFLGLLSWLRCIGPGTTQLPAMTAHDAKDLERRLKGGGVYFRGRPNKSASEPVLSTPQHNDF